MRHNSSLEQNVSKSFTQTASALMPFVLTKIEDERLEMKQERNFPHGVSHHPVTDSSCVLTVCLTPLHTCPGHSVWPFFNGLCKQQARWE